MAAIQIHCFGRLRIYDHNNELHVLEPRQAQQLLCFLLLCRDRPHARESLIATLWSDSTATGAKKSIRQALWQLQTFLRTVLDGQLLFVVDSDWISLNPEVDLWLDIALFEEAWALVQGIPGHQLDANQVAILTSALALYEGNLLETWYQEWCLLERERLLIFYLAMVDKLMSYSEAHQEYEQAIEYGMLVLRHDQAREHTHRQMMRIYYLAGNRTAALRQYQRCVAALHEELGVSVARSTEDLYQQIEGDNVDTGLQLLHQQDQRVHVSQPDFATLQHRLDQYRSALCQVQRNVRDELRALDLTARNLHSSTDH